MGQREVEVLRKGAKSAATELSATRQKLESVSSEHCAAKSLIEKLENDLIVTNKRESEEKKVKEEEVTIDMEIEEEAGNVESESAFSIVREQRDRFRAKAQELEGRALRCRGRLERAQSENATLKKENVQLFAKMKFLED